MIWALLFLFLLGVAIPLLPASEQAGRLLALMVTAVTIMFLAITEERKRE